MPASLAKKINPRVDWPRKAVHALADRSIFNGYTCADEQTSKALRAICESNQLERLYRKNLIGELKHCCGFWTVTDGGGYPVISAYPATAAAALWDDARKAIRAGLVVAESKKMPGDTERVPTVVHLLTDDSLVVLTRDGGSWVAEYREHSMGRCLMEPMAHGATLERPFGTSRISRSVMSITDDAIRQRARMEVAAEAATLPQTWLLGTYKKMLNDGNKYDASMGAVNEITKDPDGDKPTVWQSAQLQMAPLTEYLRQLACQMSAVTNVPVSFFGVSNDNPSSSDAIAASPEPWSSTPRTQPRQRARRCAIVACMCSSPWRTAPTSRYRELTRGAEINPRFLSPAYPSTVSLSDALLKQVQALPKLANSTVAYEMLDYTDEQIQRIESDAKKAQAGAAIASLFEPKEGENGGGAD
ncbi:MAG: phage portal protein [Collinsella sp.]